MNNSSKQFDLSPYLYWLFSSVDDINVLAFVMVSSGFRDILSTFLYIELSLSLHNKSLVANGSFLLSFTNVQ